MAQRTFPTAEDQPYLGSRTTIRRWHSRPLSLGPPIGLGIQIRVDWGFRPAAPALKSRGTTLALPAAGGLGIPLAHIVGQRNGAVGENRTHDLSLTKGLRYHYATTATVVFFGTGPEPFIKGALL